MVVQRDKKRCNDAVKLVYNDFLNGATNSVVLNKLMNDGYGLDYFYSNSFAYKIIARATKMVNDDFNEYRKSAKQQLFVTAMDILTECREMGDRSTAIRTVEYLTKLMGAYEADKLDINENKEITIDFKCGK